MRYKVVTAKVSESFPSRKVPKPSLQANKLLIV